MVKLIIVLWKIIQHHIMIISSRSSKAEIDFLHSRDLILLMARALEDEPGMEVLT